MSRKIIKIGKLALVTLLIMSMLSGTVFAAQASAVTKLKFRTAVVTQMELKQGSAEVARAQEVIPMYDGMRLSAGDTLRTIGEAVVYIMIDQDKIIRLDANTEAELTNTLLGNKVKITLKKGSMFFNVVEKLTEDESLQFVYGNVTMSVRGTSGSLAGSGTAFGVMLYDGKIEVTGTGPDGRQQEPLQVIPGQKYEVSQSADGKVVEKKTSFTLDEIPKSVMAELAKDSTLKERVAEGVPVSISPAGAVYAKADQINTDVTGTPDEEAMEFSKDIAQNAGIKVEPKQQKTGSDEPESTVTCPYCGKTMSASAYQAETGHRLLLVCGHHVCEAGDHGLAACGRHNKCAAGYTDAQHAGTGCGHHACEEGDHSLAACGTHYKCAAGYTDAQHAKISCGHYACEAGTHELCGCGVHNKCQIAEADWAKHVKASCGHCAVDIASNAKFHTLDTASGKYPCQHPEEFVTCPSCAAYVTGADAHKLACGHYSCASGYVAEQHEKAACGTHYKCGEGYTEAGHTKLACGHYACEAGTHSLLDCGIHYKCQVAEADWSKHEKAACGTHYKCAEGYTETGHTNLACGHYACEAGTHVLLDCGTHYKCQVAEADWTKHVKAACGTHNTCVQGYEEAEHVKLDCGHYACEAGVHEPCACEVHWQCKVAAEDVAQHTAGDCGHCAVDIAVNPKLHTFDSVSEEYPCLDPEQFVTCPTCGAYVKNADAHKLACGHYSCVAGYVADQHEKAACETHYKCETGYTDEKHELLDCGHYACEAGNHTADKDGLWKCKDQICPKCEKSFTYSHFVTSHRLPCGKHYACELIDVAGEWTNHMAGACGDHFRCEEDYGEDQDHAKLHCNHYECEEGHDRFSCGHCTCEVGDENAHKPLDCPDHYMCDMKKAGEETYHLHLDAAGDRTLCLYSVLRDPNDNWRNYVTVDIGSETCYVSELPAGTVFNCKSCGNPVTKENFLAYHYQWVFTSDKKVKRCCPNWESVVGNVDQLDTYDRTIACYTLGICPVPPKAKQLTAIWNPAAEGSTSNSPVQTDTAAAGDEAANSNSVNENTAEKVENTAIDQVSEDNKEEIKEETQNEVQEEVNEEKDNELKEEPKEEPEEETEGEPEEESEEESEEQEEQEESEEQKLPENFNFSDKATWPDWLEKLSDSKRLAWLKKHYPNAWQNMISWLKN